jgi:hypothetical protein
MTWPLCPLARRKSGVLRVSGNSLSIRSNNHMELGKCFQRMRKSSQ